MRPIYVAVSLLALLLESASSLAQPFPDFATLTGHYDGTALQIEIRVLHDGYRGAAIGLDLYRRTYSLLGCEPWVRVTDQPILYPGPPYPASVRLADAGVTARTGYHYEARPVDAERNPIEAAFPIWGDATTGVSMLAQAHVYLDPFGGLTGYFLNSCPQSCMADGTLDNPLPAELVPYVDTDTPLLLYGEVVGLAFAYNYFFPILRIDHAQPATCVVDIAPQSWSLVKRLYR